MLEQEYVQMPQDDMAQIEQIAIEYSNEPSRGLAHGVQKDAIQNGFGARAEAREIQACRSWAMTFELKTINGKDTLVFWDEGTVGLTGDILTTQEIQERIGDGTITPDQRLGRFLARFVSGGNIGAGTYGRGKLVFHAASESTSILVDSLRNDGCYLALDRKVSKGMLLQPKKPYVGDGANEFLKEKTAGSLVPLTQTGTRITIFEVKKEIVEAFRHSFSDLPSIYKASMASMIAETWWEIIHKFDAKIYLKLGDQIMHVSLKDPLSEMVEAQDGQEGIRVHVKPNILITSQSQRYRIKEIRMVVMPGELEEAFRDIWVQRKRMKIGSIARYMDIHSKISKRLGGYVILEPNLEDVIEKAEGITHYGFNLNQTGIRQIRVAVRAELQEFQRRLGFGGGGEDRQSRVQMLQALNELNEHAAELGLLTQQDIGTRQPTVEILLQNISLPAEGSLRIEMGDKVGPITYRIKNGLSVLAIGTFDLVVKQSGRDKVEIYKHGLNIATGDTQDVQVPAFNVSRDRFENGKPFRIIATFTKEDSTTELAKCSRTLYLGTEPVLPETGPVKLSLSCQFPRRDTSRVEVSEVIRQIKIRATNVTAHELSVDLISTVRYMANPDTGRPTTPLFEVFSISELALAPQQDCEFLVDDIAISPEKFADVLKASTSTKERYCDIFTAVRLSQASQELNLPRKYRLAKVSRKFYLEVDPPGFSIFDTDYADAPTNGKQSWYEGDAETGYVFTINIGHSEYKFADGREGSQVLKRYIQVQMLRQAYLIAFANDIYKGPAEPYRELFAEGSVPPKEVAEAYDTIIGTALNQMRG